MDLVKKIKGYKTYLQSEYLQYKEDGYRKKIRRKLINKDFTIISNNCWGGRVYEDLGTEYTTPTVGLFFYAPCYIKFILNLKENVSRHIQFIDESKYEIANEARKKSQYPIGFLNGEIEIHFLHYQSKEEALEKWLRRSRRINYNNLFFSFTDNDLCTREEINSFDKITASKKIFFSAIKIPGIKSLVWLKQFEQKGKVGDLYSDPWQYRKYFNVVNWLNN